MPSFQEALFKQLSLTATLTALVGQRMYPGIAPQNTPMPYVTIQRVAVGSIYHMLGPTDTHDTVIQIDCWGKTALEGQRIAKQVRHAVEGLEGPWDGLEIDGVYVEQEIDLSEAAEDGSERVYYRTVLTLLASHEYDRG